MGESGSVYVRNNISEKYYFLIFSRDSKYLLDFRLVDAGALI